MTMAEVTELDATAVVHDLFAAAGSRLYDSCLTEFERLSDIGCDLLFAVRDRPGDVPIGTRTAHPRDIAEDVWRAFVVAARRWPDRFLEQVLSNPARHDDIEILDALGEVDRPAARALLVAAVNQRRAGHAFGREYAIRSLIRLADPQVPDLIPPSDQRRLVELRRPATRTAAITVLEVLVHRVGARVTAGEVMARLQVGRGIHRVKAPCDGVVVSIGVSPGREPLPIMFRISTSHTTLVPHVSSGQG